jgi:hypothetical protein
MKLITLPLSKPPREQKTITNGPCCLNNAQRGPLHCRKQELATSSCILMTILLKDVHAATSMTQLLIPSIISVFSRLVLMIQRKPTHIRNALMMLISINTMHLERHIRLLP